MRLIIVIFASLSIMANNAGDYQINSSEYVPKLPGINPITGLPANGSEWDIRFSSFGRGNCTESSIHRFYDGEDLSFYVDFLDDITDTCASATTDDDPNNLLTWNDDGIVQEDNFETEVITCDISLGDCDITQNFASVNQSFFDLEPTRGGDGTRSGNGVALIYNTNNFVTSTNPGSKGIGGRQDISYNPSRTFMCLSKRDASNELKSSPFAKRPSVQIISFNHRAFNLGVDADDGEDREGSGERIEIYKGLDSSQRSLINDLIIERNEVLDLLRD